MHLFIFPKSLCLLTEELLFVTGVSEFSGKVLAMFSAWAAGKSACTGLTAAGVTGAGDPVGRASVVFASSAEMHCNAIPNTIVRSTNVFLARFSIFFRLITQNVLCSSKLTNV